MSSTLRLLFSTIVACLLLCACVDENSLYPSGAVLEVTLLKSGRGQVHYQGRFRDAHPELKEFFEGSGSKEQDKADSPKKYLTATELEERVFSAFEDLPGLHLKKAGPSTYTLDYEADFALDKAPALLEPQSALANHWISLVAFEHRAKGMAWEAVPQRNAKKLFDLLVAEKKNPGSNKEVNVRPLLPLLEKLRGELVIRTDGIVDEHNATSVRENPNGITEYRWKLNADNFHAVQFGVAMNQAESERERTLKAKRAAELDKELAYAAASAAECARVKSPKIREACLVRTAPPGTSCQSLIGHECVCGPFVIRMRGDNEPVVNAAYTITHAEGTTTGCTNERGETQAITLSKTGECTFTQERKPCATAGQTGQPTAP